MRPPDRLGVLIAALVLLASACTPSQVDSDATVTISGRLQNQDGSPVPSRKVILAPQIQAPELLGGVLLTALSLGTVCLADPAPEPCRSFLDASRSMASTSEGTFSFQVEGSEVRTFFGNARALSLRSDLPQPPGAEQGPAVLATFQVQTEQFDIGSLKFWEPKFEPRKGGADWEAISKDYGSGSGYRLEFVSDGSRPIWTVQSRSSKATYDPRVLEDSRGAVSVIAERDGVAPGTTTDLLYRSAQLAFRGEGGVPPSRGKPCFTQTGNGPLVPIAPCKVTDGRLSEAAEVPVVQPSPPAASTAAPVPMEPSWVVIDMERPVPLSLIVLRGCACSVEASEDGTRWSEIDSTSSPDSAVKVSTGARYVRAGGPGQALSQLREISIWDAPRL